MIESAAYCGAQLGLLRVAVASVVAASRDHDSIVRVWVSLVDVMRAVERQLDSAKIRTAWKGYANDSLVLDEVFEVVGSKVWVVEHD